MKIKFDGWKYWAFADYRNEWISFYDHEQGKAVRAFGPMEPLEEKIIDDETCYFQNCGPQCTGLWPDKNCGLCHGKGIGATFTERWSS